MTRPEDRSRCCYCVGLVVIFLALTVAAIFRFRRKGAGLEEEYLTPGYPLTPLAFLALVALLLILLGGNNPRQALLGTGVVALGLPVYYLFFRGRGQRGGGLGRRGRMTALIIEGEILTL
ncbi:MAG: hypothetical protein ABR554_01820 [Pyrinomonadaceae bacterium]